MSVATERKTYRRRQYVIKRGLQLRFILGFSAAVVVGFLVNWSAAYFWIDRELSKELYKIHFKVDSISDIALPILFKIGVVTAPLIVILSAVIGYFLTRRVELPMRSFLEVVRDFGRGDFTKRLPTDMPVELPERFNMMADSLESASRSFKEGVKRLQEEVGKLESLAEKGPGAFGRDDITAIHKNISSARGEIEKQISKFKV